MSPDLNLVFTTFEVNPCAPAPPPPHARAHTHTNASTNRRIHTQTHANKHTHRGTHIQMYAHTRTHTLTHTQNPRQVSICYNVTRKFQLCTLAADRPVHSFTNICWLISINFQIQMHVRIFYPDFSLFAYDIRGFPLRDPDIGNKCCILRRASTLPRNINLSKLICLPSWKRSILKGNKMLLFGVFLLFIE